MIQGIEAQIQSELMPGEKSLWFGKPKRGFMFHPSSLFLVIMVLFVFALVGGLIMVNNTLHFVKVIEHLTSGASARVFFTYLVSGFLIILGLVALWGFVFYPLERRKTAYALTDRRALIISGLLQRKIRSFDLDTINFTALTQPVKGKATIIFGQVDPGQYGASDPAQKQVQINIWKRFGYRFELFEVGEHRDTGTAYPRRPILGRFEFVEDPQVVYAMLRREVAILQPEKAKLIKQPKIANFVEDAVQRPGTIAFIIDVSPSMEGKKLDQAKLGLIGALDMADTNLVGLISFNDQIVDLVPVAPLGQNRKLLSEKVSHMSTGGNTALYDAIKKGIEMTDSVASREEDICTLIVLTDGQANAGDTRLDNLVMMATRDGKPVSQYSGLTNDGVDCEGQPVGPADIKGVGMVIPTRHLVRIFFVGIGSDADMEIGRILAEATGAEFEKAIELQSGVTVQRVRRVGEVDIARVLEEFKYF